MKRHLLYFLIFATLSLLSSCTKKDVDTPISSIKLSNNQIEIVKGESSSLSIEVSPIEANKDDVEWISSDNSIVTVENGVLNAKEVGEATISVASIDNSAIKDECKVVVISDSHVESITLSKDELTLTVGFKEALTASILPDDAPNKDVKWTSSNEEVATVDNEGLVTAITSGQAIIEVKSVENESISDQCNVVVSAAEVDAESITLSTNSIKLIEGEKTNVNYTLSPKDATNKGVVWSSGDATIASVDQDGQIVAVAEGVTTISVCCAEEPTIKDELTITVVSSSPEVEIKNIIAGTYLVSCDFEIDHCDAVACSLLSESYYYEGCLESSLAYGEATIIDKNKTTHFGKFNLLYPNKKYILSYVPIITDQSGTYQGMIGKISTIEITTAGYELGQSEAEVAYSYNEDDFTYNQLTYTFVNNDNCAGVIQGIIKSSDLGSTSIEEYITSDWIESNDYVTNLFLYGDTEYMSSMEYTQKNLIEDTNYTVFNVAVDSNGQLGKLSHVELRTGLLEFVDEYKADISITADLTSAKVDLTIPENISVVYYYNSNKANESQDDAKAKLLSYATGYSNKYWAESGIQEMNFLDYKKPYKLYVMAVGKDGLYGEVQCYEYNTLAAKFDSEASIEYTATAAPNSWGSSIIVTFETTLTNGAVGFYAKSITSSRFMGDEDGEMTAEDWGDSLINADGLYSSYYFTGPSTEITLYGESDPIVIIPVDADGGFGTPITYKYEK